MLPFFRSLFSPFILNKVTVVLGAVWGDEGKGKLVDILASKYNVVARFNGGANAGHSIHFDDQKFALHHLPSGVIRKECQNIMGHGMVIHVPSLFEEIQQITNSGFILKDRLKISNRAHLVLDYHKYIDNLSESRSKEKEKENFIGTTKKGIGPTYASKMNRVGLRIGDLLDNFDLFKKNYIYLGELLKNQYDFSFDFKSELDNFSRYRELLIPYVSDTINLINNYYKNNRRILIEGANGCMLDIDYGTYPFVTSSNTTIGSVSTGLGLSSFKIDNAIGVVKSYTTRVGEGPFPTELKDGIGNELRINGKEFGTTTGRPRRCGWLDIPLLQYSKTINGYSSLNLTKLDVLSTLDKIKICTRYKWKGKYLSPGQYPYPLTKSSNLETEYIDLQGWNVDIQHCRSFEELPENAQKYVLTVEKLIGVPVEFIGVGPRRDQMIHKNFYK